jgi:hypothetical protein
MSRRQVADVVADEGLGNGASGVVRDECDLVELERRDEVGHDLRHAGQREVGICA